MFSGGRHAAVCPVQRSLASTAATPRGLVGGRVVDRGAGRAGLCQPRASATVDAGLDGPYGRCTHGSLRPRKDKQRGRRAQQCAPACGLGGPGGISAAATARQHGLAARLAPQRCDGAARARRLARQAWAGLAGAAPSHPALRRHGGQPDPADRAAAGLAGASRPRRAAHHGAGGRSGHRAGQCPPLCALCADAHRHLTAARRAALCAALPAVRAGVARAGASQKRFQRPPAGRDRQSAAGTRAAGCGAVAPAQGALHLCRPGARSRPGGAENPHAHGAGKRARGQGLAASVPSGFAGADAACGNSAFACAMKLRSGGCGSSRRHTKSTSVLACTSASGR